MSGVAKKLLLSAISLIMTLGILEGAARLFLRRAPVRLRDGIYVNQIPMVTGRDTVHRVRGEALNTDKRPGEIRVFVFGESSIEGAPWAYQGSPPTMLFDQLKARHPQKDITVINMGRSASMMRDAYYYLLSIGRLSPDFIVFYQGANDGFDADREMCMPVLHPRLHGAWRWLVERSQLAWTVRVEGPAAFVRLKGSRRDVAEGTRGTDRCDGHKGFRAWNDILIETAKRTGAEVLVTTPVQNPLGLAENSVPWGSAAPLAIEPHDKAWTTLFECVLTRGCDVRGPLARQQAGKERKKGQAFDERVASWRAAAAERGARLIDFRAFLDSREQGTSLRTIYAEEVHLTIDGYWMLSWQWAEAIGALIEGKAPPRADAVSPPPVDRQRYLEASNRDLRQATDCILLHCAATYLRAGMVLMTGSLLQATLDASAGSGAGVDGRDMTLSRPTATAELLLSWLRWKAKLETPAGSGATAIDPARVNPTEIIDDLRAHPDCSTVGGAAVTALLNGRGSEAPLQSEEDGVVIPPGQEAAILAMLKIARDDPSGCRLDGVQIRKTYIQAGYRCEKGGTAVFELHPPVGQADAKGGAAIATLATTSRFRLLARGLAPQPGLVAALVESIRKSEAGFRWQKSGDAIRADGDGDGEESINRRWLWIGLIAIAAVSLALSIRHHHSKKNRLKSEKERS